MAGHIRKTYTRRIQPHPCGQCGRHTQRPKFCSPKCGQAARPRRASHDGWHRKRLVERTCVVCAKLFERPASKSRDAGLCCSRACGFDLIRQRIKATEQLRQDIAMYRQWAKRQVFGYATRISRLRDKIARKAGLAASPCSMCGASVGYLGNGKRRLYCSAECMKQTDAFKATRRIARARRKAKFRASVVESVDPIKVFERDGWRCHLCGKQTPRNRRGTHHDRAPELDHIVPLSKGGPHSYANTACSCRKCNADKGNKTIGQPSLLAA